MMYEKLTLQQQYDVLMRAKRLLDYLHETDSGFSDAVWNDGTEKLKEVMRYIDDKIVIDGCENQLPTYLRKSLDAMIESWKIVDSGKKDYHWDLNWCELNSDINVAEVEQEISSEQAWYLREKYLRMERHVET